MWLCSKIGRAPPRNHFKKPGMSSSSSSSSSSLTKEEEEEEDILARFSEPTRKRKRRQKKVDEQESQRQKFLKTHRVHAWERFNDPLTDAEYRTYRPQLLRDKASREQLQGFLQQLQDKEVVRSELAVPAPCLDSVGLDCIFAFIRFKVQCDAWLSAKLQVLGWKRNMTNYQPGEVCQNINDLPETYCETYLMATKQMLRVLDYEEAHPDACAACASPSSPVLSSPSDRAWPSSPWRKVRESSAFSMNPFSKKP